MDLKDGVLRYGIVGVGMMGREHLLNIAALPGARVTAVADPHAPSCRAASSLVASVNSTLQVFSSHSAMLDSELCDIVVISSPNMTHTQILLDVLKHSKAHHVLVEKHLCTTIADCRKVLAAAKERPEVLVQVVLEYRYMPPIVKHVKAGFFVHIRMVSIREHRFPFLVKVQNWNRFKANSGVSASWPREHRTLTTWMKFTMESKGKVAVLEITSRELRGLGMNFTRVELHVPDIADNEYVIVKYDNGARAMLDLCMFAEGSQREQEISVVGDCGKGEALVPKNVVRIGRRADGRARVRTYECHDNRIKHEGLHHGSSYLEHVAFLAAVRSSEDVEPFVGLESGLLSVSLGLATQQSIEEGWFVSLEETLGSYCLQ